MRFSQIVVAHRRQVARVADACIATFEAPGRAVRRFAGAVEFVRTDPAAGE